MNFYKKIFLFSIAFFLLSTTFISFTFAYTCPDYMFSTDLSKGMTNVDVKVIQEILNLDKRTIVAYTGPGSKGQETNFFGVATREALKRFQALFIEYIGVANGKFNSRTRTTMNAVCKGPFFTGDGGSVYDTETQSIKETTPPIVAIAGPNTTSLTEIFRAFIGGNEALQTPDLSGLIISNATAGDIRKVSSSTFSFAVTPNEDARGPITLQFEADSISDLAGNKNEEATNEWQVVITDIATTTPVIDVPFEMPVIDIPVVTPTDCSTVTSVDVNDYTNPCYGKVPMTSADAGAGGGGGGGGMEQIMQMLQGLLKGLTGMGGGGGSGSSGGGNGVPCGTCECPGPFYKHPITRLTSMGGSAQSGGYDMIANMGVGNWTGFVSPAGGICGLRYDPKRGCISPELSSGGCPFVGIIPPSPKFKWNN